jgi:Transmembrane domain of unknown function (DUF3566)
MTETTAKSGASGTSTNPVDEAPAKDGEAATGRAVVGRAAVAADQPSPKFTRAPGMTPPPDEPAADANGRTTDGGPAKVGVAVPLVSKAKKAAAAAKEAAAGAAATAVGAVKRDNPPPSGRTGTVTRPGSTPGNRPGTPTDRPGGAGSSSGGAAVGAARVTEAVRAARTAVSSAASRGARRARLNLKRIDPWSVMKFSFAVSVVLFIVVIVATAVLYLALDAMGVWDSVNTTLGELINAGGNSRGTPFRVTAWGIIGTSMLIGAVNVVLFTALATLGAFIYNVCADLVGGVELTLAERD